LIFLNKTCFNGLYRVNSKGGYNVPFGDYANPTICDAQNLRACSRLLKKAHIVKADYENIEAEVNKASFVYFDPPYRPLSKTANFTSYSAPEFGETAQVNLARFYRKLSDEREAKLLLSNSDPQNTDRTDNFFENHYAGFTINRINASRAINSKANGRGPITEILITNFLPPANSGLLEEILLNKL
jgi:DNA adenine methylase